MGIDWFDLLDLWCLWDSKGMPCTLQAPLYESVCLLGHASGQLGWTPCGEGFILFLVAWFIPIHTRMSHPLGVGYSHGWECKGCCPGGLYYVRNTLSMCTTPQKNCGASMLHEQGHKAKVLRKTVALLGFSTICVDRT